MNKNYPLLENIANLLKKEKYIFEYEFYIVNNTLHVLINEDIYTQSLYYEYFLDNSNYISKDTSEEEPKDNTEIILYREYLKEKCLCSCIRFNIHKYDSSKSKYYYIGIVNNFEIIFSDIKNLHAQYINHEHDILSFVSLYIIPKIHNIEKCTNYLKENYFFTHDKIKDYNFGKILKKEIRQNKIKNMKL